MSVDKRFFGPATPFAAIVASVVALYAFSLFLLWGLIIDAVVVIAAGLAMLVSADSRPIATGIACGFLTVTIGFGAVFVVPID
ncbi:hypothetical protein Gbro_2943 [Gordonia bronchialis DSM 43247]|uniref:Uncharacterized protein n=1 Tax=Gordonia bronchialis (strain ATCC 25592 / DSM 43247 / BCRC 13721 / JCM 3198 / KCTC 3076 / NBRC 16047 / NCTC 10667) TaxID=526226 RepID=D0L9Y6_GORB4|nr:hypothetical protein [Gordonia bronchialis]ACY22151.1 hypothetical protein Gbro_2943 [Gordonia bronchialis DSM 43247]MCC3324942.1 hypothetical protein [Gordonia bronchialis]STQ65075.1 Uncharacterised protein [Gordonia bronchialis]